MLKNHEGFGQFESSAPVKQKKAVSRRDAVIFFHSDALLRANLHLTREIG